MRNPRSLAQLLIITSLVLVAGCGSSGDSGTGPNYGGGTGSPPPACVPGAGTVCLVSGNKFSPATITIASGTNITFNNVSGTTHNVTFTTAGAPSGTGNFETGTQVVTFPTTGTFDYHCTIHGSSMSGVVVVQ